MATEYSRAWLISNYKAKIVALNEQIDTLVAAGDVGVSYSIPTGHSYSNQGQIETLRSQLEYYEKRLREMQPAYQVSRGL